MATTLPFPVDTPVARVPPDVAAYPDESSLLAGLRAGEREAAEALVDCTYRLVFALLCRMSGGDRELAADLTQETYRRAWPALGTFDGRARLSTWLYRIASNVFFNHVRRPRLLVALEEEHISRLSDPSRRQDDEAIEKQDQARLRHAVLALPEPLRFLVVAHFWGEAPVREIARAEGRSQVAIRKRLRRAFAILRRELEES